MMMSVTAAMDSPFLVLQSIISFAFAVAFSPCGDQSPSGHGWIIERPFRKMIKHNPGGTKTVKDIHRPDYGRKVATKFEQMTQHILFLCTGNYYRSRLAEQLFNARASQLGLSWVAGSRGIATELGTGNPGAISIHAVNGLRALGIRADTDMRFPAQLQEQDLKQADLIIALDEAEHRPLLEEQFPAAADRVEYWQVPDLDRASPDEAIAIIEQEIDLLLQDLLKR
jgi:protein-tyrosine phosphatase